MSNPQSSWSLTVQSGSLAGRVFPIQPGTQTIGRVPGNHIVILEAGVSGRHAQITVQPEGCWIADLGSTNGTFVNDQRITDPTRLNPGDTVQIGGVVTLGVQTIQPGAVPATTAALDAVPPVSPPPTLPAYSPPVGPPAPPPGPSPTLPLTPPPGPPPAPPAYPPPVYAPPLQSPPAPPGPSPTPPLTLPPAPPSGPPPSYRELVSTPPVAAAPKRRGFPRWALLVCGLVVLLVVGAVGVAVLWPRIEGAIAPPATEVVATDVPIVWPTAAPTAIPTVEAPTKAPTATPTTEAPTKAPTATPTTEAPTEAPTAAPTIEAPTEAPTAQPPQSSAPVITDVQLRYDRSSGSLVIYQDILFQDLDGDAYYIDYELISTTADSVYVEDGSIPASGWEQKEGTVATGAWNCGEGSYSITLQVTILDGAGNRSNAVVYTLDCD